MAALVPLLLIRRAVIHSGGVPEAGTNAPAEAGQEAPAAGIFPADPSIRRHIPAGQTAKKPCKIKGFQALQKKINFFFKKVLTSV